MGIRKEDIELIKSGRYTGESFIQLNNNKPYFTIKQKSRGLKGTFEKYSKLDRLRRCGMAFACITKNDLKKRNKPKYNSRTKPTARKSLRCEDIVDGGYLYNRCHLIGRQLATKRPNGKGLIMGTRWFNCSKEGMSKFETEVVNCIEENPDHHILYRVTPYFENNNLLACGVQMEILDLDDEGSLSYNVFVYNKQPGFTIDYRNGDVYSDKPMYISEKKFDYNIYVIDMDTNKFHKESCTSVSVINHRKFFAGKKQTIEEKYCKCENCIS